MALYRRAAFEIRQEYAVEYVEYILSTFLEAAGMTTEDFVHGKGKHKTLVQRLYEKILRISVFLADHKAQVMEPRFLRFLLFP